MIHIYYDLEKDYSFSLLCDGEEAKHVHGLPSVCQVNSPGNARMNRRGTKYVYKSLNSFIRSVK